MSVAVPPALPTAAVATNTVPPAASPPTAVSIPSPVAPAIVAPTPPLGVPVSGSAQVMQAHFHLMEQFLASQQAIMQQYLARSAGQPTLYAQPMAPVVPAPAYAPVAPVVPIVPVAAPPVPPPEVVVPPVVVAATPLPAALTTPAQIQQALLQMVSDRTGYPIEMLGLSANLEADLGIDSIKRVEIMGAFSRETGLFERSEMDRISSLKTLKEIVDFLQRRAGRSSEATTQVSAPVSEAVVRPARLPFPFLRTVRTHIPEQELVALCVIDLAEDLFLHDHTLGRTISAAHPELLALPIVPLTISMEIMAEAAAALFPQLKVVGMRSLRAYRWILIEASQFPLIVVAKQSGANEVSVYLHEADDEQRHHNSLPIMEGTILLAADYPAPPPPLRLEVSAPSRWQPDALYREGMFHGPAFRAVAALERSGANGAVALLQALPTTGLFRSYTDPQFVAEPVILDAAGQVVGFWTLEQLTSGFVVFPYHCAELDFYGPPLRTPETVRCSAQITATDDGRTLADLDLVDEAGHVRMRLRTWEDKRFDLPRSFYRFLLDHRHATLAEPLVLPIETGYDIALGRVMGFPERFFVNSGEFWGKVLAYVVLNAQERLTWQSLKGPQKRRSDWLLGRVALKETVRRFVRERYQLELCLADIEVVTDAQGRPAVRGAWLARLDAPLAVSLAHSDGAAVAAVGHVQGLGIDMELLQRQDQSFREIAFTAAEQTLISQLVQGEGGDWPLRLWCAKESVGKALGYGLVGGPHSIVAHEVEVRNGIASMTIAGELARRLPEMEAQRITAWTVRAGEMIIALALIP